MDILNKVINLIALFFCYWGNLVIIVLIIINIILFARMKSLIKKIYATLLPSSDKRYNVKAPTTWTNTEIKDLSAKRDKLIRRYTMYANFTAVFPLLGILGTVAALVTYSSETMMENFMVALTTTLLGVLAAILFKTIDSLISADIDLLVEDISAGIQKFYENTRNNDET